MTSTSAPGTFGTVNRSTRIAANATTPTTIVVVCRPSSDAEPVGELAPAVLAGSADDPVSFGSSPITTSIAAPNRNPVMTALERNRDTHPILNTARRTNSTPAISVTAATSSGASSAGTDVVTTALAATAASAELGPVEIWRDVPNSA